MEEVWKAIPGASRYEISSLGQVRANTRKSRGKIKQIQPSKCDGYKRVTLFLDTEQRRVRLLHQLVLETFVGPRPEGMQVRHLNGVKTNNQLTNLAWGTWQDNYADKVKHGTTNRGERSRFSKLNADEARAIRASEEPLSQLARRFGISKETARKIRNGVKWAWL